MGASIYTPGHGENATDFMAQRTLQSHGEFFQDCLEPGLSVLDCGCGPGTITLGIAARVSPGRVLGVDFGASQIECAIAHVTQTKQANVEFAVGDCYGLCLPAASVDRVFSHALLEHLADPLRALNEFYRVLRPGGKIGVCSPDWGGFLMAPSSPDLMQAIDDYTSLQRRNGGDVQAGRKLGVHLGAAGFREIHLSARYECYRSLEVIGNYLAIQLERAGNGLSAKVLRDWSACQAGMFAQAWVAAVATK